MVVLALWGFMAPRAVACCCPKSSCTPKAHRHTEPKQQQEESHSCCHRNAGAHAKPAEQTGTATPETPHSPHKDDCRGCSCGTFCCAKLVVPVLQPTQHVAPAPVESIVIPAEALPASIALSPMLKPPRSV